MKDRRAIGHAIVALAAIGMLAAVHAQTHAHARHRAWLAVLPVFAVSSVAAKTAEVADAQVLAALGFMSGHTLKHLLAAAAAALIIFAATGSSTRVRVTDAVAQRFTDRIPGSG